MTMTATSHKAAALTAASALALYDAATTTPDKLRAAAAMAEVLRASASKAPKKKASAGPTDILNAPNLIVALKRLTMIVERRSSIPILSTVLLKSKDGRLTLYATDLDMIYSEVLRAPGLPSFRMAINANALAGAIRGASGEITFRDDTIQPEPGATYETYERGEKVTKPRQPDYFLTVLADGLEVKLPGFALMKVPQLPENVTNVDGNSDRPPAATTIMATADFLDILSFVQPAISKEETHYYLNGVYLHTTVEMGLTHLNCVATDGSRLLKASLEGAGGFPHAMPAVIIPRKSVEWLLRNLKDDELQIDVWEQQIRFTTATGCFQSKLIDGSFPDYQRVIPSDRGAAMLGIADGKATGAVLGRVLTQSAERIRSIRLHVGDGKVGVSLRNLEGVTVNTELPGVDVKAESGFELSFNGAYLREMIETDSPVDVEVYPGDHHPAKFTWPGKSGRLGVLMPLRA